MSFPAGPDNIGTVTSGQTVTSAGQNAIITAVNAIEGAVGPNPMRFLCEKRLSLTTGVPVTTSDVSSATHVYLTSYIGNRIAVFNEVWKVYALDSDLSLSLGTLSASTLYDVFCYDNAGTPTLELGPAWTNESTRSTGLVLQDGILVKDGATTRRYLGTFRTTSTTETADTASNRLLWNHYNRVPRTLRVKDSTTTWAYTTATWRQANGSGGNGVGVVVGLSESMVHLEVDAARFNTSAARGRTSIGINSTSTPGTNVLQVGNTNPAGDFATSHARYDGYPSLGYTSYSWLEMGSGAGTDTWAGTYSDMVSGMTGFVL